MIPPRSAAALSRPTRRWPRSAPVWPTSAGRSPRRETPCASRRSWSSSAAGSPTPEEANAAVELASEALRRADETLRARFSPQITAEAGHILAELTENKYPRVLLEPDMHLSVREADGQVMRPAAAMSCGTADQMYLALRLAMCRRLLPPDAPMVLDDALVNFDPVRTRAALRVLREEPRQILLFTCRPLTQEEE